MLIFKKKKKGLRGKDGSWKLQTGRMNFFSFWSGCLDQLPASTWKVTVERDF